MALYVSFDNGVNCLVMPSGCYVLPYAVVSSLSRMLGIGHSIANSRGMLVFYR